MPAPLFRFSFALAALVALGGCEPDRLPTAPTEVDRPVLDLASPLAPTPQALYVDLETSVVLRFSEPMDPTTFEGHFLVRRPDGTPEAGTFTAEGTAVRFTPAQPLQPATRYRVELRGRVKDANGNSIERNGTVVLDDTTLIYRDWLFTEGAYVSPTVQRLFVLDRRGRLWPIDSLQTARETVTEGLGNAPRGVVMAGSRAAAINPSGREVVFYDVVTGVLAARAPIAAGAEFLDASGGTVYTVHPGGKQISVIDAASAAVTRTISLPFFPGEIALSPDGARLYTINQVTGDLVTIDAVSGAVAATLPALIRPPLAGTISVHPTTGRVYVADPGNDVLHVVAPDGTAEVASIGDPGGTEGWRPFRVQATEDALYVAPTGGAAVYRLSLDGALVRTYPLPSVAKGLLILDGGTPLVALSGSEVTVFDTVTGERLRQIDLPGSNPDRVAVVP